MVQISGINQIKDHFQFIPVDVHELSVFYAAGELEQIINVKVLARLPHLHCHVIIRAVTPGGFDQIRDFRPVGKIEMWLSESPCQFLADGNADMSLPHARATKEPKAGTAGSVPFQPVFCHGLHSSGNLTPSFIKAGQRIPFIILRRNSRITESMRYLPTFKAVRAMSHNYCAVISCNCHPAGIPAALAVDAIFCRFRWCGGHRPAVLSYLCSQVSNHGHD